MASIVMGPIGWVLTALWTLIDIAGPAFRVTVCLYGIVRLQMDGMPSDTICNPFFGLKKVSMKTGLIAWCMQILYLGVIVSDLYF